MQGLRLRLMICDNVGDRVAVLTNGFDTLAESRKYDSATVLLVI